jgi:hypothetical protein
MVNNDQPDLYGLSRVTIVNSIAAMGWGSTTVESPSLRFEVARCGENSKTRLSSRRPSVVEPTAAAEPHGEMRVVDERALNGQAAHAVADHGEAPVRAKEELSVGPEEVSHEGQFGVAAPQAADVQCQRRCVPQAEYVPATQARVTGRRTPETGPR